MNEVLDFATPNIFEIACRFVLPVQPYGGLCNDSSTFLDLVLMVDNTNNKSEGKSQGGQRQLTALDLQV